MSFSSDIKNMLTSLPTKKACCKKALLYGLLSSHTELEKSELAFATDSEKVSSLLSYALKSVYYTIPYYETSGAIPNTVSYYKMKPLPCEISSSILTELAAFQSDPTEVLVCPNCLSYFFRGLFLSGGTVSDPSKKGYHLELLFKSEAIRTALLELLENNGFSPKATVRKGSISIYFKNSENIEDFLTVIGAPHAALELMNAKIMREIRNNENRRSNCDASNIFRSTGAADMQIRAIKKLVANGKLSLLPKELQTTAMIRLNNPECSLAEVASLHEPALTKSGVNHRIKKIIDFSNEKQ